MMADKLLNAQDLITAKKLDTFRSEVITGKAGGLSTGANIDYATNAVTGQVQKTLPKILNDLDWSYVGLFADGVTFTDKTDFAVDAVGTQWIYTGSLPFSATAGTVPSEPTYQVVHVRDHNSTSNRNAIGAHDEIYRRAATVAEVQNGDFEIGARLSLIDRACAPFDIKGPGWPQVANGMDVIGAGDGNVAVYQFNGEVNVAHIGAKNDYRLPNGSINPNKTDNSDFINRAVQMSLSVLIPNGEYFIKKHVRLKKAYQHLYGTGMSTTALIADSTMEPATIGGSSGTVAVWYQPDNGNFDDPFWINGGYIGKMTIYCSSSAVEAIRVNRVCQSQVFDRLHIFGASKGIYGTFFGWGTSFRDLYIHDCEITAIHLSGAYNACTFSGVKVWGGDLPSFGTQVLVLIENDCYGNSWTGGYIEKGLVGVRLVASQLSIQGCDFEAITESFIQVSGRFSGPSLIKAAPVSDFSGNTFVGATTGHGVYVKGGKAAVRANHFINTGGVLPNPTTRAVFGELGGNVEGDFGFPCISELDNEFVGWGSQTVGGVVFTRADKIATKSIQFPFSGVETAEQRLINDFKKFSSTNIGLSSNTSAPYPLASSVSKTTKIGDLVTVTATMVVSALPAHGSFVTVANLEYPPNGLQRVIGSVVVGSTGTDLLLVKHGSVLFNGASAYLSSGGSTPSLISSLSVGDTVAITLTYHV